MNVNSVTKVSRFVFKNKGLLIFVLSLILFLPVIINSSPIQEEGHILKTDFTPYLAAGIFILLYIVLLTNKITPALVTMFGALIFIFIGFLNFDIATSSIDWNTISLLCGMMILVGIIKSTGFFQYIAIKIVKLAKGNLKVIWIGFCFITAIMSAFLDNVTTILIIAPITMLLTDTIEISPVPFLISEAICANIGGTATLIGDPPNILIGSAAGLSFVDFILNLAPVVIVILIITILIFYIFNKKNFAHKIEVNFDHKKTIKNKTTLTLSLIVFILTLIAFILSHFFHLEPGPIALFGAILLMIIARQNSEEWFKEIEWDIIFFFIGLFIMVEGLETQGILQLIGDFMVNVTGGNLLFLSMIMIWIVGIASAFLGAVPIVTTLIPIIFFIQKDLGLQNVDVLWWSMSLGACLGGNGTVFGTTCNMVTVSLAKKRKDGGINFVNFFKAGFPLTILSLIISSLYIYIFYFVI